MNHKSIVIILSCLLIGFEFGLVSCGENQSEVVVAMGFSGKHYLEVANLDTLSGLNQMNMSVEIWAAGDASEAETALPLLFLGNSAGGTEVAFYREAGDSSGISVDVRDQLFGQFSVGGLDWRRAEVHYLCLTRFKTRFSFYFDGKLLKQQYITVNDQGNVYSNMLIGSDNTGYWQGTVREVRFWSKKLESSEVAFHHRRPDKLTEHYSPTGLDNLEGLWRFQEKTTDFVPDASKNDNPAYIHGDPGSICWIYGSD
jgi:hypothetical protein